MLLSRAVRRTCRSNATLRRRLTNSKRLQSSASEAPGKAAGAAKEAAKGTESGKVFFSSGLTVLASGVFVTGASMATLKFSDSARQKADETSPTLMSWVRKLFPGALPPADDAPVDLDFAASTDAASEPSDGILSEADEAAALAEAQSFLDEAADLDELIQVNEASTFIKQYASVIAAIVEDEASPPMSSVAPTPSAEPAAAPAPVPVAAPEAPAAPPVAPAAAPAPSEPVPVPVPVVGEMRLTAADREFLRIQGQQARESRNKVMRVLHDVTADLAALDGEDADAQADAHARDVVALQARVRRLLSQLRDRTRLEALRLHDALERSEESMAAKYEGMFNERLTATMAFEMAKFDEAMLRERTKHQMVAEQIANDVAKRWLERMGKEVAQAKAEAAAQQQEAVESAVNEAEARMAQRLEARAEEIRQLKLETKALKELTLWHSNYEKISHQAHEAALSLLGLEASARKSEPLGRWVKGLRHYAEASEDPVVLEAVAEFPTAAAARGAPTVAQLARRFKTEVRDEALRMSYVPVGSGLLAHLVGFAASAMLVSPADPANAEGNEPLARLSRAAALLEAGRLAKAVAEVEALVAEKPSTGPTVADWLEAAQCRLVVEQTTQLLHAHVATTVGSLN